MTEKRERGLYYNRGHKLPVLDPGQAPATIQSGTSVCREGEYTSNIIW